MEQCAGVVMAAGMGTRMKSDMPKVLHKLCGRELVHYPVQALREAGIARTVVVVSRSNQERVQALLGEDAEYACQVEPLGTGNAVLQTLALLEGQVDHVLVLGSDSPLIRSATLRKLAHHHLTTGAAITLLSARGVAQEGLAVVLRDGSGRVVRVQESAELENDHVPGSGEINAGAYCFDSGWLWRSLPEIAKSSVGEFYLTSLVEMAFDQGCKVEAVETEDPLEVQGINDRVQLAQAELEMRRRIRDRWMLDGVTMMDPASIYLDAGLEIGRDTVIYPNTMVLGSSRVGSSCVLGPGTLVRDSTIGNDCKVVASFLEEATLEDSVDVGPYSHLRPGAYLESHVHVGNFAEIKNSRLGRGTAMGHLGYVGDASIGADANLGAGMVTCNYDGVNKHRTVVEDGAFVGCDTMLVAPVTIGAGAVTGAGSVVIEDVPPGRLAVGVPATIKKGKKARQGTPSREE